MGDPLAGAVPGTLLPDTMRSIVVVSRDGELAVALRDAVDAALTLVRDVRPDEAGAAVAACRPWPWMLAGDGVALPGSVIHVLRTRPVVVLWKGRLPDGMPAHAVSVARFSQLVEEVRAAGSRSVAGLRLAPGAGVVTASGAYTRSAPLQALVSLHPRGFDVPLAAFRGAAVALARCGSAWRPALAPQSGRVTLARRDVQQLATAL
ncbi:MAG: hypothetical protein E6J45_06575 [Chloroflexi bacterium]|nr:MAG: hypothetical protein E6J45_06575 [Chloroflexota bacterium]